MRGRITAAACAVMLACTSPHAVAVETAHGQAIVQGNYPVTTVTIGSTETLPPPLPRGQAWYSGTSIPSWAHLSEADGSIELTPSVGVDPGDYQWPVVAHYGDESTEIIPVRVTVANPGTDEGVAPDFLKPLGFEQITPKCSKTSLAVGIPLLALIPLGFATQMGLPIVAVQDSVNLQITNLAKPVNIHLKPRQYNRRNADLGIASVLTVAGLVGGGIIYSACASFEK